MGCGYIEGQLKRVWLCGDHSHLCCFCPAAPKRDRKLARLDGIMADLRKEKRSCWQGEDPRSHDSPGAHPRHVNSNSFSLHTPGNIGSPGDQAATPVGRKAIQPCSPELPGFDSDEDSDEASANRCVSLYMYICGVVCTCTCVVCACAYMVCTCTYMVCTCTYVVCTCTYMVCTCTYMVCTCAYMVCTCTYVECTCTYVVCTCKYMVCAYMYIYGVCIHVHMWCVHTCTYMVWKRHTPPPPPNKLILNMNLINPIALRLNIPNIS